MVDVPAGRPDLVERPGAPVVVHTDDQVVVHRDVEPGSTGVERRRPDAVVGGDADDVDGDDPVLGEDLGNPTPSSVRAWNAE